MIMADVDMKQKIKEVRDKFLSNNQIEDIRQNIVLGVEERLKFLNSEQIKVVELLEEKHRELDFSIQSQTQKISEHRKGMESTFEVTTSDLLTKYNQTSEKISSQNKKLLTEYAELEDRLEEKFKDALKGQLAFIDDSLAQFSTKHTEFKEHLGSMEGQFSEKIEENNAQVTALSEKNLSEIESKNITLLRKLENNRSDVLKIVDEKLSTFEEDKSELLKRINADSNKITFDLEKRIEGFLQNHETVEEIIDNRLKEFRAAQKAAFEELEAALNLLEKHQDDTLTRFRQKSDITNPHSQNRQNNLPNSLVKNRGSILYHSENFSESSLPTVDDAIETTATVNSKKSDRQVLKPTIIALVGSVIFIYVMSYFGIDYSAFINFSKNLTQ